MARFSMVGYPVEIRAEVSITYFPIYFHTYSRAFGAHTEEPADILPLRPDSSRNHQRPGGRVGQEFDPRESHIM